MKLNGWVRTWASPELPELGLVLVSDEKRPVITARLKEMDCTVYTETSWSNGDVAGWLVAHPTEAGYG